MGRWPVIRNLQAKQHRSFPDKQHVCQMECKAVSSGLRLPQRMPGIKNMGRLLPVGEDLCHCVLLVRLAYPKALSMQDYS